MKLKSSNNIEFYIDDEDYELVSKYKWRISKKIKYPKTTINRKTILLHRLILGVRKNEIVDHINGNSLDNRKSNLRKCTYSQNSANSVRNGIYSIYKGVTFDKNSKRKKKWKAAVEFKKKTITIGRFLTEEEAATAYNKKAYELWGNFAIYNDIINKKQKRYKE